MRKKTRLNDLPIDLVAAQILARLPVKSLVRFTSVCKTWYSLIKSPHFIATHLNLQRSQDKGQYHLIFDEKSCYIFKNLNTNLVVQIDYPFASLLDYEELYADSCNGLILHEYGAERKVGIMLWNPSIRKYKNICITNDYDSFINVIGLGFHESSNDHRVVRIVYVGLLSGQDNFSTKDLSIKDLSTKVEVYSLRTDSWHGVDSSPGRFLNSHRVFLYGSIHWLSVTDDYTSIVLFDFETECFREMGGLPTELNTNGYSNSVAFSEYKGSLATVHLDGNYKEAYVWHMTRYGISESWAKIFTIRLPEKCGLPLGFTKSGMLVYEDFDKHSVVDIEKCCFICLDIQNNESNCIECGEYIKVTDYIESLALL